MDGAEGGKALAGGSALRRQWEGFLDYAGPTLFIRSRRSDG